MKFLLDQGLPRSAVRHLQGLGFAAEHVGDLGLAAATDEAILAEGRVRGAIVVTFDADFHSLLAQSNAGSPTVIRIRIQGLKGDDVARLLERVVNAVRADVLDHAVITVSDRRVALRRLPLLRHDDVGPPDHGDEAG